MPSCTDPSALTESLAAPTTAPTAQGMPTAQDAPILAVVDIGTVTARCAISHVRDGRFELFHKQSTICNLGEGVDATGMLAPSSIERVTDCVSAYVAQAHEAHAQALICTLTSAARDASNADVLLDKLHTLGLDAQVIPGEVEGQLTFLGVTQDFPGTRLLVADNGGGSTELACGVLCEPDGACVTSNLPAAHSLRVDLVRSTNVGCRRLTERFLSHADPPSACDLRAAHEFAASLYAPVLSELTSFAAPERLVATGGTVTTMAAVKQALVPYDSSRVHLHTLKRTEVEALERRFSSLTVQERAQVAGMQAKRAPVILAGMVAISELMAQTGFDELTVSESDLLVGLSLTLDAAYRGKPSPVGWIPSFTRI